MGNVTVFEATLFDYNGVLVDDEEIHFEAFAEVLRGQDVEVSREAYWKEYLGYDDVGGFEAMLRDAGRSVSRKEIDELVEAKKPVYLRLAGSDLSTFPDAAKVFAARAAAAAAGKGGASAPNRQARRAEAHAKAKAKAKAKGKAKKEKKSKEQSF